MGHYIEDGFQASVVKAATCHARAQVSVGWLLAVVAALGLRATALAANWMACEDRCEDR